MKFLPILTVCLILIIAIVQAVPITKRALGSKVGTLGVSFEDSYKKFNGQVKAANKKFEKKIALFNKVIPDAAKDDHTDAKTTKWLLDWNAKYEKIVGDLEVTSKKLDKSIATLGKHLKQ
ncbi:19607_t:CDS:1 [Funneliformis geosporum]|uniref:19224_t:CDS:1 n=1 Tax=Funneliformis geosporum TaxID=1117311 RepID=A0A9W4SNM4_9GLOM|nr:19224_t:CDS:1 [Funneliformis geosporum]CAI2182260.1 19607_t:CDS:1 [Funneliformis geosporum]